MTEEEQERYDAYNKYYGNRDYLFDLNSIPTGSSGFGYDIPADALSDPQFAKMIQEAEKYLGVPYVWGGYSLSGFDCSGFVSYCLTGRYCRLGTTGTFMGWTRVSDPQPGDVVVNSYHTGIYIGNGQMIHASDYKTGVIISSVAAGMNNNYIFVRY